MKINAKKLATILCAFALATLAVFAFFVLGSWRSMVVPIAFEIFVVLCMLAPLIRVSWPTVLLAFGALLFGTYVAIVEFKEASYVPASVGSTIIIVCIWAGAEVMIRGAFMLDIRRSEAKACMVGGFLLFTSALGLGLTLVAHGSEYPATPQLNVIGKLTASDVDRISQLVSAQTHQSLRMIRALSHDEVEVWAGKYESASWQGGVIFYLRKNGTDWSLDEEKQGKWDRDHPRIASPQRKKFSL